MAYAAEPPKHEFRLSQLIYDTRYRRYTIQVVALILFLLSLSWLLGNLAGNLAAKGKDIDFSFLWNRAGYDIGQHLIPYTNDNNHLRAALVGLVNTLLVSVVAAFFATVLGVVIGVLRLSKRSLCVSRSSRRARPSQRRASDICATTCPPCAPTSLNCYV